MIFLKTTREKEIESSQKQGATNPEERTENLYLQSSAVSLASTA
jgi:hypothetical protein